MHGRYPEHFGDFAALVRLTEHSQVDEAALLCDLVDAREAVIEALQLWVDMKRHHFVGNRVEREADGGRDVETMNHHKQLLFTYASRYALGLQPPVVYRVGVPVLVHHCYEELVRSSTHGKVV